MFPLSKTRVALLNLFLTKPESSFYMQEVGRIIGKKPGTFQRTINDMVSDGILTSEYKANARFFRANKEYPIYKELKSIVLKTVAIQKSIRKGLKQVGNVKISFIYGPYVKDKETFCSDIDLVVIGNVDEDRLLKELYALQDELQRAMNCALYTFEELKKEIEKEPIMLHIIRDKKIMLIGNENELLKFANG